MKMNSMVHFKVNGRELCTSTEWKLRPEDKFLEDLPENTVDDGSLLAYATVMKLRVTGTCGDESTIEMGTLAVGISKPVVLRTRAHRTHRLIRTPKTIVFDST